MPFLNFKVSAKRSTEMTRRISAILLDLTSRILHKDLHLTSIAIEYVDPEDWIIAGKSLAEQGKSSIYFDIKITDETNTKLEKAAYIASIFKAFSELLGDLHDVSYVYIQDVRATSYGYGGKTQEYRFHQPAADPTQDS